METKLRLFGRETTATEVLEQSKPSNGYWAGLIRTPGGPWDIADKSRNYDEYERDDLDVSMLILLPSGWAVSRDQQRDFPHFHPIDVTDIDDFEAVLAAAIAYLNETSN
jgi:hypothetical protein